MEAVQQRIKACEDELMALSVGEPSWLAVREDLTQLRARETILTQQAQGNVWKQQDSKALHRMDGTVFMYANIFVVNDDVQPPVECRMRALVDSAAGHERIILRCKAQQLKLRERSRGPLKGFEEGRVDVIKYAPVLVKLPSDNSSGQEQTFREADLTVYANDVPLDQQEDLSDFAGFRQPQQLSPAGDLQLTSVSSPPRDDIATAIIGMEGLRKLQVTINPEQALLCPTEHWDECLMIGGGITFVSEEP